MADDIPPGVLDSIAAILESLRKRICIPCALHRDWPPPDRPAYAPARAFAASGLAFAGIELLHAIGVKYSGLSGLPEEVAAHRLFLAHHLDLTGTQPRLRHKPLGDFAASLSHEIGVGFCCLAA